MPGNAVVRVVTKWAPQVLKYGPIVYAAVRKFLEDHPNLPEQAKDRLADIANRLRLLRPGDAAQIKGKLAIVRDEVGEMPDLPAEVSSGWLKRASNIEHAANLAGKLGSTEQRKQLKRLRSEADVLLSEVISAIAYVPPEA